MVVSLLSCLNANQLFCTRTLYAMSCDCLFFRSFTRVNQGGTPTLSLLLSTIVSGCCSCSGPLKSSSPCFRSSL